MNFARLVGNWSAPAAIIVPDIPPPSTITVRQVGVAVKLDKDEAPSVGGGNRHGGSGMPDEDDNLARYRIVMELSWELPQRVLFMKKRKKQTEEVQPLVLDIPIMKYTIVVGLEKIEDPFGMRPMGSFEHNVIVSL